MNDEIRRNLALFPIGIVQKLTDLSARQIRYYEQHNLIRPARTEGNQRLFSFNDVGRLLEIKKLIDRGLNIAGIKTVLGTVEVPTDVLSAGEAEAAETAAKEVKKELSNRELLQMWKKEMLHKPGATARMGRDFNAGELSRFFH